MKTLTTFAVIAALASGLSIAAAQNAPTTKAPVSPDSINKGTLPGTPSGAESQTAATGQPARIEGHGKFCSETANNALNCKFASMSACEKQSKADNLHCVANPNTGTTGARH